MSLRSAPALVCAVGLAVALSACGGGETEEPEPTAAEADEQDAGTPADGPAASSEDSAAPAEQSETDGDDGGSEEAMAPSTPDLDSMVEGLESQQEAQGGGGATLTVGDQKWTFDRVLCAFGPEEIGQEGAEFVLSSIQDGAQFYISVDSFGHSVSLNDIENFSDPSVSLSSDFGAGEFIVLDGKNVSGEVGFIDDTGDSFEPVPGSFEATCP